MGRQLIAGLIVVGLAVGVWVLWPKGDSDTTTTTPVPLAQAATTSSTTTTTTNPTTLPDSQVVTTVEEAEEILRELWFGWFEGIYNQDEDRVWEVVGTDAQIEAAIDQFGQLEMTSSPTPQALKIDEIEILRSDSHCLALWAAVQADFRPGSTEGVHVLRMRDSAWVSVSFWAFRGDLWEQDCDALLSPLS